MKLSTIICCMAFLAVSDHAYGTEYKFTWYLGRDKLEYKVNAEDKKAAFKMAAQSCFEALIRKYKPETENAAANIIDICVNPR